MQDPLQTEKFYITKLCMVKNKNKPLRIVSDAIVAIFFGKIRPVLNTVMLTFWGGCLLACFLWASLRIARLEFFHLKKSLHTTVTWVVFCCSSNTSFNVVNHFVIWKLFTGLLFVSFTQNCQIGTFSFEKVSTYYRNTGCFLTTSYLNCWYNFALIYQ